MTTKQKMKKACNIKDAKGWDFYVDYVNRVNEYCLQNNGRRFLEIHSFKIDIDELYQFMLLQNQVNGLIPSGVEYTPSYRPYPDPDEKDNEDPNDNGNTRLINNIQFGILYRDNGESVESTLGTVTLSTHMAYLLNRLYFYLRAANDQDTNTSFHAQLLNLKTLNCGDNRNDTNEFVFEKSNPTTYTFSEKKRPQPTGVVCWQGISGGIIPMYLSHHVLDGFSGMVADHHPKEVGAILGGQLSRDGNIKYTMITDIMPIDVIGDETQLTVPAEEFIRISRELNENGRIPVGWMHSHGFGRNALGFSQADIQTQHEHFSMPYGIAIVADGAQLRQEIEKVGCQKCSYQQQCALTKNRTPETFIHGWSAYGWTQHGSIVPVPIIVFK